jgi:2-phospho-L-lactate guanylyltransferase (CobY/MobA/RfbA family)
MKGDSFTIQCDVMVCKDNNTSRDVVDVLVSDIGQHANNLLQNKVGVDVALGQPRDIHI